MNAARAASIGLVASCIVGAAAAEPKVETAATVSILEGPTNDAAGNVYFTDVVAQRILKLGADGVLTIFRERSNVATGLVLDAEGRLIACEAGTLDRPGVKFAGSPRITRTTIETGVVEVLAESGDGLTLVSPNDVTIDSIGRVYFTDMGAHAVYRIDAPGRVVRILGAPDVQNPNGVQIAPGDRTLYVSESGMRAGDRRDIRAFDLLPDGSAQRPRLFVDFHPGRSADGISVDVDGNVYVSAGMANLRGTSETLDVLPGVHIFSPAGQRIGFISIPQDPVTNNAFGGPDRKVLYVTAGSTLYRVRTSVSGLPR